MKFSLILASRDRVSLLNNLFDSLLKTTINQAELEVLVVFDEDDVNSIKNIDAFNIKYKDINVKFFTRPRSEWMHRDYINWVYPNSKGKFIIILNDDTRFINKGWDIHAWKTLETYLSDKPDGIVYGFTENMTNNEKLCYFPLVSREAINALGMVMPPERKNWGADHDLYAIYCNPTINRKINLPEIQIEHISYHTGSRDRDPVSYRVEKIFQEEKKVTIPIKDYVSKLCSYIRSYNPGFIMDENKRKVLVIYNICGISGYENVPYYLSAISSILNQNFDGFHVVISSCMSTDYAKKILTDTFGNRITYNWIQDKLPLNVTFNDTVRRCVKSYGKFENYLYVDSGITFGSNLNVIKDLYELMNSDEYAMTTAQVDEDSGYLYWGVFLKPGRDYLMPIGKTVNLHCQMFSHAIYENYQNKIMPDIFANHTSESVYTFINAAINKKWAISHKVKLHHESKMDGPSSGFLREGLLFKSPMNIRDICKTGHPYGFGYEEYVKICLHDPAKFDANGYALDKRLLPFIKQYVYLQDKDFDYKNINTRFVATEEIKDENLPSPAITCLVVSDQVEEAIASLLNQDFQDWQAIVIGNYESTDTRILCLHLEQSSLSAKFNECFKSGLVKGYLVTYLDKNDIFYSNAFSSFVELFKYNKKSFIAYANQDLCEVTDGYVYITGESRSMDAGSKFVDVHDPREINCSQICHRNELINVFEDKILWKDDNANSLLKAASELVPINSLDVKIGQSRKLVSL